MNTDTVRHFRNADPSGPAIYPDGLVHALSDPGAPLVLVKYVSAPEGLEMHRFYVTRYELSRISSPVFDIGHLWVVTLPGKPTFYLNGKVQGILDHEHAARVAADVLGAPVHVSYIDRLTDIIT